MQVPVGQRLQRGWAMQVGTGESSPSDRLDEGLNSNQRRIREARESHRGYDADHVVRLTGGNPVAYSSAIGNDQGRWIRPLGGVGRWLGLFSNRGVPCVAGL